jgi:thioredoxin-dependent peroxiredoxin
MKLMTIGISVLFACALSSGWSKAAELKVGDDAPDFKLQASDGKEYKLSDFKGKQPVVLAWFPKAFTGGCTAECKSMKESGVAIRKYDVAYFTASVDPVDGPKGNKAFAESLSVDYPILSDPSAETAKAYGVYNEKGKIANRVTFYIDRNGKIAAIDKTINTKDAGKDVATKLKEVGAPEKH